jgi:hypothetical protein
MREGIDQQDQNKVNNIKEFGECQIPYTQKTSFVDLGKE